MPQEILPLIPSGATPINEIVSVWNDEETWTYFLGSHPVYKHPAGDKKRFALTIAQLIDSGSCRQVDIIKAFGISKKRAIRAVNKYREEGEEGFFGDKCVRRGPTVMTENVVAEAERLFEEGASRNEVALELDVRYDTLRKAINQGRVRERRQEGYSHKSERTARDAAAGESLGIACTRGGERVLAAAGALNGASTEFKASLGVANGGVICALPSLLYNGLFEGVDRFISEQAGYYYTRFHILLLLAYMALCRIRTVEQLRGYSPGEFGALMGLDRIPEVRCLRQRLDAMAGDEAAEQWAAHLSRWWMEREPDSCGYLYVDGHVSVYHGGLTRLPRRFVSRERLCLRGVSSYWVNDALGCPFFAVEKQIDPGLLHTLRTDIVPRLLEDVPGQPSETQLKKNRLQHRFVIVFDREGYSPGFFRTMWRFYRIACMTYNKYPGRDWPQQEFCEYRTHLPNGETAIMSLAERGTLIGSGSEQLWVREIRKLTESGHQTSIITTAYTMDALDIAPVMFSRWCQENFLAYMMQHFALDLLPEHGTEQFPGTERVVNPRWRELNRQRNSCQNKLRYRQARFAELTMHPAGEENPKKYERWLRRKAELKEEIDGFEIKLNELKNQLKNTEKHITWEELPEQEKFRRLPSSRKRLLDTVRMIAYRAETAMTTVLADKQFSTSQARSLLRQLYVNEADIIPEPDNGVLRVRVHSASTPAANRKLIKLFESLNQTETVHPGTELTLVYELAAKPP